MSWTQPPRIDTEQPCQYWTHGSQLQLSAFGLFSNHIRTYYNRVVEQCLEYVSSRIGLDKGDKVKVIKELLPNYYFPLVDCIFLCHATHLPDYTHIVRKAILTFVIVCRRYVHDME